MFSYAFHPRVILSLHRGFSWGACLPGVSWLAGVKLGWPGCVLGTQEVLPILVLGLKGCNNYFMGVNMRIITPGNWQHCR